MRRVEFLKDKRGISGVVVAILLTVIGIAGVVLLWSVIFPMFYSISFKILDAKIKVIDGQQTVVQIEIWNTGSIDITKLEFEFKPRGSANFGTDTYIVKGERRSFVDTEASGFEVGTTYVIKVKAEGRDPFGGKRTTEDSIEVTAVRA